MTPDEIKHAARELVAKDKAVFVLSTVDAENRPQSRYMGVLVFEGDFEILMVSNSAARKVEQIKQNPNAQLLFASEDYNKVVTLSGKAAMEASLEKKKEVWDKIPACADYHESPEAADFGLIRFKTKVIEYLDLEVQHEPLSAEL